MKPSPSQIEQSPRAGAQQRTARPHSPAPTPATPAGRGLVIERGVPLPPHGRDGGAWKRIAASMAPGDSIAGLTRNESKRLIAALYLMDGRPRQRSESAGIRVWRTQ